MPSIALALQRVCIKNSIGLVRLLQLIQGIARISWVDPENSKGFS